MAVHCTICPSTYQRIISRITIHNLIIKAPYLHVLGKLSKHIVKPLVLIVLNPDNVVRNFELFLECEGENWRNLNESLSILSYRVSTIKWVLELVMN